MDALLKKTDPFSSAIASRLCKPLAILLERLRGQHIVLTLSAGADSAMLAVCVAHLQKQYSLSLSAVHIHHGLMPEADHWQEQAILLAQQLAIPLHVFSVNVDRKTGLGLEAAARKARYDAFMQYAKQENSPHFLLAHHQDDQAETLLLRLFRGTGIKGMRGMQAVREENGVYFYRPWLGIKKADILSFSKQYAEHTGWYPVHDGSNRDTDYKRGAFRTQLLPHLDRYWKGWQDQLIRYARLTEEAHEILEEVAKADLLQLDIDTHHMSFCLQKWRDLPKHRQSHVLRYWLSLHGIMMPTERRLQSWIKQFREVHQLGFDRSVTLAHDGKIIRVSRGRVHLSL